MVARGEDRVGPGPAPDRSKAEGGPVLEPNRAAPSLAYLLLQEPELITSLLEGAEDLSRAEVVELRQAIATAVAQRPRHFDLRYFAALAETTLRYWTPAAQHIAVALQLKPRDTRALLLAGRISEALQRPAQAIRHLESAVAVGARYCDVYTRLGNLYRQVALPDRARRAYAEALLINPHHEPARTGLLSIRHTEGVA